MTSIISYIHPSRTFIPCSGVGRHVNNLLLSVNDLKDVRLTLLYSKQWLTEKNELPDNAPLRHLKFKTFESKERLLERSWKLFNWPKMDQYLINNDWMFSPVETRFPVRNKLTAITIHDIQAFETTLPWSETKQHQQFKKRWGLWVFKAAKQADLVFTVSEFSRERLIDQLKLPENKVIVSGNAVDPSIYDAIQTVSSKSKDYPYIVVIGGLRTKKGGEEILLMANQLKRVWPELKIISWGENDPLLIKRAQEIGNMITYGMISDQEMIAWLKGAHSSIFLSWYEGFGIPILEAMASGVPVICSNLSSLPEIASDAALMANPKDTLLIIDYILQLRQTENRNKLIFKGYKNIERFNWDRIAQNVVRTLQTY